MSRLVKVDNVMMVDQSAAESMLKLPKGVLVGWVDRLFNLPYYLERGKKTFKLEDLATLMVEVESAAEMMKGKCIHRIREELIH